MILCQGNLTKFERKPDMKCHIIDMRYQEDAGISSINIVIYCIEIIVLLYVKGRPVIN
jgi:hypothetical protein